MRITGSQINMTSSHIFSVQARETESLEVWNGGEAASLLLSPEALLRVEPLQSEAPSETAEEQGVSLSAEDELKIKLLETFLQRLLGKKIKIQIPDISEGKGISSSSQPVLPGRNGSQASGAASGFGLSYTYSSSYQESESLTFSSRGLIKTSDGKEIAFDLAVNLSRSYASEEFFQLQLGAAKVDPLVINIDAPSAGLSDLKIRFDLNSDGKEEEIHFLSEGSGFLALDQNGDGRINDGTELFGPSRGDGFAELSDYDEDGNSWIDEADSVFQRLTIWTKDESGRDRLLTIAEAGVGAIYLGHVNTAFTYKNSINASLAELAKTGIYLKESGAAGTVQHIDYFV